jgi:hypothetical protein
MKTQPNAYAIIGINANGRHYTHAVKLIEDAPDGPGAWQTDDGGLGEYWSGNEAMASATEVAEQVREAKQAAFAELLVLFPKRRQHIASLLAHNWQITAVEFKSRPVFSGPSWERDSIQRVEAEEKPTVREPIRK